MNKISLFVNSKELPTTNNGSTVQIKMSHMKIPNNSTIAVVSASIWWNFPNISPALNNNVLNFSYLSAPYTINLVSGLYDITALQNEFTEFFKRNNLPDDLFEIVGNNSTSKIVAYLNYSGITLNFTTSSIAPVMGFVNDITVPLLPPGESDLFDAENIARFNNVNEIQIHTDFTYSSNYNGKNGSSIIASIQPNVNIGNQIIYTPLHLIENTITNDYLDDVYIYITDENNNRLDTGGEYWQLHCQIKIMNQ